MKTFLKLFFALVAFGFIVDLLDDETTHKVLSDGKNEQLPIIAGKKAEYDSLHPCLTERKNIKRYCTWENPSNQIKFSGFSFIQTEQACLAEQNRESMDYPTDRDTYWQKVYQNLVWNDYHKMPKVYEMFRKNREDKKLNYIEFAEMVVSFIQEIPYVLVHPDDCDNDAKTSAFSLQYHSEGKACLPNKKFGVQAPSEFMFNFKGDCDTRAVFAYTVLSHFGYDVVVFGSSRHAMLGINMAGQGNYLMYQGKKYYFWETTGKGWLIGAIPPEYQSDDWGITLLSMKNN